MVVTLEVSQLEMSALKFFMSLKSLFMSVISETHQSAMGPYSSMAAVGSALYAWTAVCREALVVKVFLPVQETSGLGDGGGGEGGGGGGDGDGGEGDGGDGSGGDGGGAGGGGSGGVGGGGVGGRGGSGEGDKSGGDGQLPGPQLETA